MTSTELVVLMLVVPLVAMLVMAWGVRGDSVILVWHALRQFALLASDWSMKMTLTGDALKMLTEFLVKAEQDTIYTKSKLVYCAIDAAEKE